VVIRRRSQRSAIASRRSRHVASLPPEQRAALVLRDFEGLSYEEVAAALDVSVAAVKGRIHRARLSVLTEAAAWH
jgi:RNA polymerase sigma-70 factor, ECF subfamily